MSVVNNRVMKIKTMQCLVTILLLLIMLMMMTVNSSQWRQLSTNCLLMS